jgi:hypothetical protein
VHADPVKVTCNCSEQSLNAKFRCPLNFAEHHATVFAATPRYQYSFLLRLIFNLAFHNQNPSVKRGYYIPAKLYASHTVSVTDIFFSRAGIEAHVLMTIPAKRPENCLASRDYRRTRVIKSSLIKLFLQVFRTTANICER